MSACIEHCVYCFDVLAAHLEGRKHLEPKFENEKFPLFVTWNLVSHGLHLRGCIGNFEALPLHSGLRDYTINSAFNDKRFSPITLRELTRLQCVVSLLTNFEDAEDYLDWEVGLHGIWIEFDSGRNRRQTATYLPEVAEEQGWTKVEAIDSLLRKGGFTGQITDRVRQGIILTRYQSTTCEITYDEYLQYIGKNTLETAINKNAVNEEKKKTKRLSRNGQILLNFEELD